MKIKSYWGQGLNILSAPPFSPQDILLAQAKYFNETIRDLRIDVQDGVYIHSEYTTYVDEDQKISVERSQEKIETIQFTLINKSLETIVLFEIERTDEYPVKIISLLGQPVIKNGVFKEFETETGFIFL